MYTLVWPCLFYSLPVQSPTPIDSWACTNNQGKIGFDRSEPPLTRVKWPAVTVWIPSGGEGHEVALPPETLPHSQHESASLAVEWGSNCRELLRFRSDHSSTDCLFWRENNDIWSYAVNMDVDHMQTGEISLAWHHLRHRHCGLLGSVPVLYCSRLYNSWSFFTNHEMHQFCACWWLNAESIALMVQLRLHKWSEG